MEKGETLCVDPVIKNEANDIAIVQEGRKWLFYFDVDLNIINLNNRKKIKFLEGISSYDFIWVK